MNIYFWAFGSAAFFLAVFTCLCRRLRPGLLGLWGVGLAMGAVYLSVGAEALAVIQWVVSTAGALSTVFFVVMFDEPGAPTRESRVRLGLGLLLGLGFCLVVGLAVSRLSAPPAFEAAGGARDLAGVGDILAENQLLSAEILGLTLLLALVGGGVVARSNRGPGGGSE